jgi:hypothetical protein
MPASAVTRNHDWWPVALRLAASVGETLYEDEPD